MYHVRTEMRHFFSMIFALCKASFIMLWRSYFFYCFFFFFFFFSGHVHNSTRIHITSHKSLQFISKQRALNVSVISGKPEVHPRFFCGIFFSKTISDFKIAESQLINKSPYDVMLISSLFTVIKNTKQYRKQTKLALHHMGFFLLFHLPR